MVHIYTTPSCSSCVKAKKWFQDHKVEYREKNIFSIDITKEDIYRMITNSLNGFSDIVSTRSKIILENNIDIEDMTMSEVSEFIINNPSVLRRPIMIEDNKMQVGYNEDEIRVFIPKRLRQIIMHTSCDQGEACVYERALKTYIQELDQIQLSA